MCFKWHFPVYWLTTGKSVWHCTFLCVSEWIRETDSSKLIPPSAWHAAANCYCIHVNSFLTPILSQLCQFFGAACSLTVTSHLFLCLRHMGEKGSLGTSWAFTWRGLGSIAPGEVHHEDRFLKPEFCSWIKEDVKFELAPNLFRVRDDTDSIQGILEAIPYVKPLGNWY